MEDFGEFFSQFQDHLAPKLDVYEQAIYLYIVRHTLLVGQTEATIGFKSARKKLAFGVGTAGAAPSENTCYVKLRSLAAKKCIEVLSSERSGTRVRIYEPSEIVGVLPAENIASQATLETCDFFSIPENRALILERDGHRCFYCLAILNNENYVIEHVVSRPIGDDTYRNVVAACRRCNNRKNAEAAEDHLRTLYRESILSTEEFKDRCVQLEELRAGNLRPMPQ